MINNQTINHAIDREMYKSVISKLEKLFEFIKNNKNLTHSDKISFSSELLNIEFILSAANDKKLINRSIIRIINLYNPLLEFFDQSYVKSFDSPMLKSLNFDIVENLHENKLYEDSDLSISKQKLTSISINLDFILTKLVKFK